MDKGVQKIKNIYPKGDRAVAGAGQAARRKPAGRKPNPAPEPETIVREIMAFITGKFPGLREWMSKLPDARVQGMCVYEGAHIWMQILTMFLTRAGSRNAFDGKRNTGQMPKSFTAFSGQRADDERFDGAPRVTCGDNAAHHAARTDADEVAMLPVMMIRQLIESRTLDHARLFKKWHVIIVDGTVREKCRKGNPGGLTRGSARYHYVLQACILVNNIKLPLIHEFVDINDPIRDKEDCELNAFRRLARKLKELFPRLPIIIVGDALYCCAPVAEICEANKWKYLFCIKEGRQPSLWSEVLTLLPLQSQNRARLRHGAEDDAPLQDFRWVTDLPFGKGTASVILEGDVTSETATLYAWITNMHRLTADRVTALCAATGRKRHCIEDHFNTQKNNGPGLGHAFCANETASKNYYSIMQCAQIIWELFYHGHLARLYGWARQTSQITLARMIAEGMRILGPHPENLLIKQLRFVT